MEFGVHFIIYIYASPTMKCHFIFCEKRAIRCFISLSILFSDYETIISYDHCRKQITNNKNANKQQIPFLIKFHPTQRITTVLMGSQAYMKL